MNKKFIRYFIFVIILIIISTSNVFAIDYDNLCSTSEGVMQAFKIISYVILIIRWLVPLIIIILGMIDFSKAVFSDDEKADSKALNTLIRRIVAGVVIFFIPTIVMATLNVLEVTNKIEEDNSFAACTKCIFDINECSINDNNSEELTIRCRFEMKIINPNSVLSTAPMYLDYVQTSSGYIFASGNTKYSIMNNVKINCDNNELRLMFNNNGVEIKNCNDYDPMCVVYRKR